MCRAHGTKGPEIAFQCFEETVPQGLLGMKSCARVRLIVGFYCTLPTEQIILYWFYMLDRFPYFSVPHSSHCILIVCLLIFIPY